MWLDYDLGEARCARFNTRYSGQEIKVGVRAPGVAVGASWLGSFGPRCQSQVEHLSPRPELAQVLIRQAGLLHGSEQVEAEVIGALGQFRISQHRLHHTFLLCRRNRISENGEDVRMLAEVLT